VGQRRWAHSVHEYSEATTVATFKVVDGVENGGANSKIRGLQLPIHASQRGTTLPKRIDFGTENPEPPNFLQPHGVMTQGYGLDILGVGSGSARASFDSGLWGISKSAYCARICTIILTTWHEGKASSSIMTSY